MKCVILKPFTSDGDSSPCARNQTQLEPGLGLEPTLISEFTPLTWCLDLLRLRFFVSLSTEGI